MMTMVSGALLGQIVAFSFSPIVTRIYSPEIFGIQGIYISILVILWPLTALRYPVAIIMAESDAEVRDLSRLSLLAAGLMSLMSAAVIYIYGRELEEILGMSKLGSLIWFLPGSLFLIAVQEIMEYRSMRMNAFRTIAVVSIVQNLIVNIARTVGGLIHPVSAVLVVVTSLSYGLQAALLYAGGVRHQVLTDLNEEQMYRRLLKKYRGFPLYRMPSEIISAISQTLPVFLLAIMFDASASGHYALARSVVSLPVYLICGAAGNVLYSRMAEMARQGVKLFPFALRIILLLLIVPGGGMLIVSIYFRELFALVFGADWQQSGDFARWMTLWVVCLFGSVPSERVLAVIGRQSLHLMFSGLVMFGGLFAMLVGKDVFGTEIGCVASHSGLVAGLYVIQIAIYLDQVRRYDRGVVL